MSFNMLTVIARKNITLDETVMIPSAYYHLAAGNFQLVADHPPLSKILAALPLLFIQPAELSPRNLVGEPYSLERKGAYQGYFWHDNRAEFERISFWARVPMIALAAGLGILIFIFARHLFGPRAAVFAVALYSLEPTVLAHGRVVQTDVPAAFGYLLVCFTLYRYLRARHWRNAVWLGLACGIALLSKFSMLIIAPALFLVLIVLMWKARKTISQVNAFLGHAAIVVLATLIVIHAAYYFHSRSLTTADSLWIAESFPDSAEAVSIAVHLLSHILPTDFVLGVFWQLWHSAEGHPAGFLGMYSMKGWWYYFPVAFALKTTIPFLLLSLASLVWATYRIIRKGERRLLILIVPFAIYTVFIMLSPINIGVRYYLPAYTFLFIFGGVLLDRLLRQKAVAGRIGVAMAVVLIGWMGIEALRAYPDYMTYMNQLASQRPHWWYLSDSNVEWADDIKGLEAYLRDHGETEVRSAMLGGFMLLDLHGIKNLDLITPVPVDLPEARYTAIGASMLNGSTVPGKIHGVYLTEQQRVNYFDAYRNRTPEAVIGGSIYLYREHE
jgi:dolichyl-phosphate-mannose-protein mannosyltransferase/uncharacterized protein DUF6056